MSLSIQQTLHGYSDGHRLLKTSKGFDAGVARLLLRMSDLSGGTVVSGFEEYLTGYPVDGIGCYALAKTWYAHEMPRPGCVWTHTLFIPNSAMEEIPCLASLSALFARPKKAESLTSYSEPIKFSVTATEDKPRLVTEDRNEQVKELMQALYVRSEDKVLITAQAADCYEAAILDLWSQQWPELRRVFTFCTGALSSRGFIGKPFDVQCTAPSLVREITTTTMAKMAVQLSPLIKADRQDTPAWLFQAADDVLQKSGGDFRRLLWAFADLADRNLYYRFAQIIDVILTRPFPTTSIDELVAVTAQLFPEAETGSRLKSTLFGGSPAGTAFDRMDEEDILTALASTPHYCSFDAESLSLKRRGGELCHRNSSLQVISRLFRSSVNRLGEAILEGIVATMTPMVARALASDHPQLLPTLFRAKPELGASPELWIAAGDRKRELLEAIIAQPNLPDALVRSFAPALLAGEAEFLLKRALATWGEPLVFGVLDYLASGGQPLSVDARGALTFHVPSIVKWTHANAYPPRDILIAAAHIIAPYTYEFRQADASIWLEMFEYLRKERETREATFFAAMLLALALQNTPPKPLKVIEECFEHVHEAAAHDELSDDAWTILDPIVPQLSVFRHWDKCERLRRGLVGAFVKFQWPGRTLIASIKSKEILLALADSALHVDGGKSVIARKY